VSHREFNWVQKTATREYEPGLSTAISRRVMTRTTNVPSTFILPLFRTHSTLRTYLPIIPNYSSIFRISLSLYQLTYPPVCFIYLPTYLPTYLPDCLSIYISMYLSMRLYTSCLSACLPKFLPIYIHTFSQTDFSLASPNGRGV